MTTIRPMVMEDLRRFQNINFDMWTETFNMNFYLSYLTRWPELCLVAENCDGSLCGYLIGKVEGVDEDWHCHVSAVTVAPEFRRTGLAKRLMCQFEDLSEKVHACYFSDLFVKSTNVVALKFYESLGYVIYRTIIGYYSGDEDAYDMRKPLSRDKENRSIHNSGQVIKGND